MACVHSCTKGITALAIHHLIDEGRLELGRTLPWLMHKNACLRYPHGSKRPAPPAHLSSTVLRPLLVRTGFASLITDRHSVFDHLAANWRA